MTGFETSHLIFAMLAAAFFGSWHCAVMCGPIAASMSKHRAFASYNCGRLLSYLIAGVVAGEVGGLVYRLNHPTIRLVGFVFLTLFLVLGFVSPNPLRTNVCASGPLRSLASRPFGFGIVSILLPCGWLWTFLMAATATGSGWAGGLVLLTLWLSSFPSLFIFSLFFEKSGAKIPRSYLIWMSRSLTCAALVSLWTHYWR